jgi:DNA-binding ferritin-like protein
MDEQQKQNITQVAEQLTDSTQQAFRTLAERTVALQESNLKLTQNFVQNWIEQVHNRAQGIREATHTLQEQGQRQREAVETLSQEATNAYSEFLNSALSFYQETLYTTARIAQGNVQVTSQSVQQTAQAWDESRHPRDTGGAVHLTTEFNREIEDTSWRLTNY